MLVVVGLVSLTLMVCRSALADIPLFLLSKAISLESKFFLQRVILPMFVLQILSLVIEFIVIEDDFDDLHRIVTDLHDLFLGILRCLAAFFFHFPEQSVSILKSILLDIVLQPAK